jgi:hypothetical protein
VIFLPFPFPLTAVLHGPATMSNLTPRYSGKLIISNQANGMSMARQIISGPSLLFRGLTRICSDKDVAPAIETLERNTVIVQTKEDLK